MMSADSAIVGTPSQRVARLAGLATLCLFALSASLPATAASPETIVHVEITKFTFAPMELTVAPGTHVVWTNHDDTPHSVLADDKSFASTGLDTNDTFEYAFTTPGDYAYVCSVHPFMKGIVHVRKP